MTTQARIQAALGYCELDMFEDALDELESLPAILRSKPEILQARLYIQMRAKTWPDALGTAQRLLEVDPSSGLGFMQAAFCLHEMGRTEDAKSVLLRGPRDLQSNPTFYYNLACYDAVLGNLDEALAHLDASIQLDGKYAEIAKSDPDLSVLKLS